MTGVLLAGIGISVVLLCGAVWWLAATIEAIRKKEWNDVVVAFAVLGVVLFLSGIILDLSSKGVTQ